MSEKISLDSSVCKTFMVAIASEIISSRYQLFSSKTWSFFATYSGVFDETFY